MNNSIISKTARIRHLLGINVVVWATLAAFPAPSVNAADIQWQGPTASYTNTTDWVGGVLPGAGDNAINDHGTANAVQINVGDPDWTVGQIRAGNSAGNGAFEQNGQIVTPLGTNYNGPVVTEFFTPFRLGIVAAYTGVYTLNGGTLNYGTGPFHVGEVGAGTLNLNGGTITGSGVFSVNSGGIAVPNPAVLTATAGHGPYLGDYTYFEQGYFPDHPTAGLPAPGSTIVSVTQGDHSYTFAPSYTANDAVILDTAVPSATITLATPKVCSGLSFMGSAGNGPVTNNYTVHYASGASDTGTLIVPDWFGSGQEVLNVEGRVDAIGANPQYPGTAGGNPVGNAPYLFSVDISLVNTDKVVSIDLTYVGGNGNAFATATLMAVSGQDIVGNPYTPLVITGYNADVVVEAGAPSPYVSSSVMDTVNQTGGTNNIPQLWVAQGRNAHATYNLHGGEINSTDWNVIGRSGGYGTMNMDGGTLTHTSGGQPAFIIGSAAGNNLLSGSVGVLNQSAGTINCNSEYWLGENTLTVATNNISGTAVVNINSWLSIGRGGLGVINMTGGTLNKNSNGAFIVGDGGDAIFNLSGGTISNDGELWVGNSGGGHVCTINVSGGLLVANNWFRVGRGAATALLNFSGGTIHKTTSVGGNFIIGDNNAGSVVQTGGTFIDDAQYWIGNNNTGQLDLNNGVLTVGGVLYVGLGTGSGTFNLAGGTATVNNVLTIGNDASSGGTLNLNSGTLTANEIAGGSGYSALYFNGGTLVAGTNNANFMHGLSMANVAGAAVFDTAGFNVTVPQVLADAGGGLTKNGAGMLTLTGANTYSGATTINAGTLATTTASTANGDYTVASSAGLSVQVVGAADTSVNPASVNLANASALSIDLNALHPTTTAPLNVTGVLTANGTITVNYADSAPVVGTFTLVKYGNRAGSATFVLGTLPSGVAATLVDNTGNKSIDLQVTQALAAPRWDGSLAGGIWDINTTANWYDIGALPSLVRTVYKDGMAVLFDDNAANPTVTLNTTVAPKSVTVNNSTLAYTLTGAGKITGATDLVKQGTGTLAIQTGGNDYAGATVIANGTLSVSSLANGGSPSAIGASSADPANLVLAGGTLSYSGVPVTINRGYSVQATNSSIETVSNLTLSGFATAATGSGFIKVGDAQLTYSTAGTNSLSGANSPGYLVQAGSVLFDGSAGGQTNTVQGDRLGVNGVAANATVIMTNTTMNVGGNVDLGNVPDTIGTLIVNSNVNLTVGSWFIFGDGANSVGTCTLNGGTMNVNNGNLLMGGSPGTTSTLNINGGLLNKSGGTVIVAPGNWNGDGARTGTVNQSGGTFNCSDEIQLGQIAQGTGFYNLHGGELDSTGWFVIGRAGGSGTMIMDGGILNHTSGGQPAFIVGSGAGDNGAASVGFLDQSAGTINCTSEYWVAENTATVGTNNIRDTAVLNVANWVSLGRGGHAVVNFSGGTITKTGGGNFIIGDNGNAYFNQTGGALTINSELWVGQSGGGVGQYDLSAGTVSVGSWLAVGRAGATGTLNISGGASLTKLGNGDNHITIASGGPGTVNQTGGTITSTQSSTFIGEGGQPGLWNMDGGSAVLSTVFLPINSGANGTLNLNGGTFSATEITSGNAGGTGALNFNGGTLAAGASTANFLHGLTSANVLAGGAVIDSGANVISVAQPLLDGGGAGGLTKIGAGTLYLNGANTYTGPTLVNAGTLGGTGAIAGPVTVAAGAALAPGASIGTLTINNTLTLSPGSTTFVEISLDGGTTHNDLVTGLTGVAYSGALVVSNVGTNALVGGTVFKLFQSASPGSGNFSSVRILPSGVGMFNPATGELTIPPTINPPHVSGGNLILTGVGGTPGGTYSWLTSTNIAAPVTSWTTNITGVFDGSGAFSNAFPNVSSEPARFFLLKTP